MLEPRLIIDNGEAISDESMDLNGLVLCGLYFPDWTAAAVTFQGAPGTADGVAGTFAEMYNENGSVRTIASFSGARHVMFENPSTWAGVRYIKIRSGTSGTPVNQGAERTIRLICRAW